MFREKATSASFQAGPLSKSNQRDMNHWRRQNPSKPPSYGVPWGKISKESQTISNDLKRSKRSQTILNDT